MATKKSTTPAKVDAASTEPAAVESAPPPVEETLPARVWIRHDSPRARQLDVPLLRRFVDRGEAIEVSRAHAEILTRQAIWTITEAPKPDTNADGE